MEAAVGSEGTHSDKHVHRRVVYRGFEQLSPLQPRVIASL